MAKRVVVSRPAKPSRRLRRQQTRAYVRSRLESQEAGPAAVQLLRHRTSSVATTDAMHTESTSLDGPSPRNALLEDALLEARLLSFDVEEDLEAVVPMPPTIPLGVRHALTKLFIRRFTYYRELDLWLHLPHPALRGRTPYERIVDGDGVSVLRALLGAQALGWRRGTRPRSSSLQIVR